MSFAARSVPPERDLFQAEETALACDRIEAAAARLAAAQADCAAKERRYRFAPRGEVQKRLRAFQEATHEALRAAAELAALRGR